ncbi:ATP synthase subunit G atp20 [Xanthoria calcicola]
MSANAARLTLRQIRIAGRQRHASTTSQAADAASSTATKSKEAASNATSKASQGLTRVTSSAGPALSRAGQGLSSALGKIGGRTGRLISFAESLIPPTIYYSKVGFELSKIVFRGQKMSPPNLAAFQSYSQPLLKVIRQPATLFSDATTSSSATPTGILTRIRNANSQQVASAGVVFAEVLGFFTVGEMIGRFKVVGYRGGEKHH